MQHKGWNWTNNAHIKVLHDLACKRALVGHFYLTRWLFYGEVNFSLRFGIDWKFVWATKCFWNILEWSPEKFFFVKRVKARDPGDSPRIPGEGNVPCVDMASWCWWCLKMVFWREEARTPNGGEHICRTQSGRTERRTHRTYLLLRSQALRCWNWPLPYKRAQDYETATSLCFWYGAGRTDETGRDHYGYVCIQIYWTDPSGEPDCSIESESGGLLFVRCFAFSIK